ncbi:ESPR-type extended signal peptide-containing protein, partial [Burkholderia cepacia]|uniref:ESPR-type extended signal peptide-containing protein n=1 Tax=Burkholderia cepacia TaxID=292 RepID=UPI000FB4DD2E
MNKSYRNVWNAVTGTWTAVAETAKSHSKGSSRAARQAVIAIALGSAAIGAAAAEVCKTDDGASGTLDSAGICQADSGIRTGAIGTMAALEDTYFKVNSTGAAATAGGANSIAIGQGANTRAGSDNSIAIGNGAGVNSSNRYIPVNGIAIGNAARVVDSDIPGATGSIALGDSATAGGNGAIVIGAGARNGNSGTVVVGLNAYASGGGVVMGNSTYATSAGVALGPTATATGGSSIALGSSANASASNAVAIGANSVASAANTVSVGSDTIQRRITNMAAGTVSAGSFDAVNGSQLYGASNSIASAIGGGSTVNPNGSISAPVFTVGDGLGGSITARTVADAVSNLDGRTTNNEGSIEKLAEQIGSGALGLVQQANPGDDITVGANTDGDAVNFSSKTSTRKLTGITAGDVSAISNEAVNGSQLHSVADSVASAIGGGSTVKPDGSISAPSFTVGDGSGGTKIVNSVGGAVTNLNDRVTSNEG